MEKNHRIVSFGKKWILGQPDNLGLGKNLVYKVFSKIREVCLVDVPPIFSGVVEFDETYLLAGKRRIRRKVTF